jgi:transposase
LLPVSDIGTVKRLELVKEIRKAIKKKYSAEDKICIVLEALRGEISVNELYRREGIASV